MTVRRSVGATPADVFALLCDPERHVVLDGSGMIRGAVDPVALTGVGQVFVMEMYQAHLGPYRTANAVTVFEPGRRIGWETGRPGEPPAGQRWDWQVEAGPDGSVVTHTYDWSRMTDPAVLARIRPPRVSREQLDASLARLAAAAERAAAEPRRHRSA